MLLDAVQPVGYPLQAEPLEDAGHELHRGRGEVEQHAPEDLEEERVLVPHDERMPESPGEPDVEQQRQTGGSVAEEGDQDGRLHQGPVFLQLENVDQEPDREPALTIDQEALV